MKCSLKYDIVGVLGGRQKELCVECQSFRHQDLPEIVLSLFISRPMHLDNYPTNTWPGSQAENKVN